MNSIPRAEKVSELRKAERTGSVLYEIINLSDQYTIEAHALDVAFVACLLLGRGQYSFEPIISQSEAAPDKNEAAIGIPLFLFGGADQWCQQQFREEIGETIRRVTHGKSQELADCLDSCLIGGAQERQTYTAGLELIDDPGKREIWRSRWHDERRSSLNDIGGRAYEMAKRLRSNQSPFVEAPPQVFANRREKNPEKIA